ncbi:hypothetical protein [Thermobispora bispora]|uniref:hypothetical protein n=1 Tax=Thermobispora bispora TaxID=2006 RepID=UPI001981C7CC|nr:hypothetical protein [Thermobispora bispora]
MGAWTRIKLGMAIGAAIGAVLAILVWQIKPPVTLVIDYASPPASATPRAGDVNPVRP